MQAVRILWQPHQLNLIFVSDHDRMTGASEENRAFYSAADVGFISQNVYLFCASEGWLPLFGDWWTGTNCGRF
jgi:hypothetical protein